MPLSGNGTAYGNFSKYSQEIEITCVMIFLLNLHCCFFFQRTLMQLYQ